jgi:hypothetical protein
MEAFLLGFFTAAILTVAVVTFIVFNPFKR